MKQGTRRDTSTKSAQTDNVIQFSKRRMSVDLSTQTQGELTWLMTITGSDRRSDVIGTALILFSALADMEARNLELFIQDSDGANSLFIPSLRAVNGLLRTSQRATRSTITLELARKAYEDLDNLKKKTGEKSKSDVIRQSIHLYWVLVNEVEKGRRVIVKDRERSETYDLFDLGSELDQKWEETARLANSNTQS